MKRPRQNPAPATNPTEDKIRERAYYLWLERGCPHGNDQEIWFAARVLLHDHAHLQSHTLRDTVASHQEDPQHHYHNPATLRDKRPAVAVTGAMQRIRADRPQDRARRPRPHSP